MGGQWLMAAAKCCRGGAGSAARCCFWLHAALLGPWAHACRSCIECMLLAGEPRAARRRAC
jgi:hypothetical protein